MIVDGAKEHFAQTDIFVLLDLRSLFRGLVLCWETPCSRLVLAAESFDEKFHLGFACVALL